MKNADRPTAVTTPEPAELIRAKLDAGFAAVQTGKMRSQMGLADALIEEVRLGGILHDIGKIGVPEAILNKPSRLTLEEYEVMKIHSSKGAEILEHLLA